jgi:hypothetical protein
MTLDLLSTIAGAVIVLTGETVMAVLFVLLDRFLVRK